MNKKLYEAAGISLLKFPTTKKNSLNNKRRNVSDIGTTSAAHMIGITDIRQEEPLIFCGKYNKALPVVRQLIKMSSRPFLILGTKRDLAKDSCLRLLDVEWEKESLQRILSKGNGVIVLKPGAETNLMLKEYLSEWDSHLIIMCLGNGIQVDQELLNLLNSLGHYILLSETLQRSIKYTDGCKLTVADLLSSMDYILVSSIGTSGKELIRVLPDYDYEKVTNTADFSIHKDAPHEYKGGYHHRNGGGLRFGQSKTQESRYIFTQDDLTKLQDSNTMIIYNAHYAHIWVARISG